MAFKDIKDLPRRTTSDEELRDKSFNIARDPKYDGYQRWLAWFVDNVFDKNISGDAAKSETMPNQQLAEELLEPIIGKFEKPKVYSIFEESI